MLLVSGKKLGAYEIQSPLGALQSSRVFRFGQHALLPKRQAGIPRGNATMPGAPSHGWSKYGVSRNADLRHGRLGAGRSPSGIRDAAESESARWDQFAIFYNAYRKREYHQALEAALRVNLPGYFYTHAMQVAAYGQLGERAAAQLPLQKLLALRPNFASEAREAFGKWQKEDEVGHLLDGLRKAGLDIADPPGTAPA